MSNRLELPDYKHFWTDSLDPRKPVQPKQGVQKIM